MPEFKPLFYFSCLLTLLFSLHATAQKQHQHIITIRQLSMEDGLVSRKVNCGLQDGNGFVWFGTTNGLQRYDGSGFKLLTREKNMLQGNNIADIVEDGEHRLWVRYGIEGTDRYSSGRVDILDSKTLNVQSLRKVFGTSLPFSEHHVKAISSNERNELIIVESDTNEVSHVYVYTPRNGFRKIASDLPVNYMNPQLLVFHDQRILFYSHGQTGVLSLDGKVVYTRYPLTDADNIFPLGIKTNGQFFSGTSSHNVAGRKFPKPVIVELMPDGSTRNHNVQLFDKKSYTNYQDVYYQTFYDSRSGNSLIYQQKKGLILFDSSGLLTLADSNAIGPNKGFIVYDYFTSSDHKHWLCTSKGVFMISVRSNLFEHLLSTTSYPLSSVLDHQTRSIYADTAGHVYVNSWGGFYCISHKSDGNNTYAQLLGPEVSTFNGFYFDGRYFWMASSSGKKVSCYDISEHGLTYYDSDSLTVWSGVNTRAGHLILGSLQGFHMLKDHHFEKMYMANTNTSPQCWVYQFFYDRKGLLWAVTNNGLFEFDARDQMIAHYSEQGSAPANKLPYSDLHAVYEDKQGNFWMASNGAGLVFWNRSDGRFRQYTVADGLSSNVLYAILPDEKGFLWISSDYGLMRFNPLTGSVKTYTTADGITDNEFNRISYFKAQNGRMYFGGMNGVNAFLPSDFPDETTSFDVPLRVTSLNQYDGASDRLVDRTLSFLQSTQIVLHPGDRFFTLAFQLLDFEKAAHRYAYKIDGVDKQWNYINENTLRISGLPYGKFVLHIKGQNAEGAWSKSELSIPVLVQRPLSGQWWFRILVGTLIAGFVVFWYKRRTRALKQSKQALERTVGLRTEQLKKSLGEKDVLLKEIHHRVKNNLQVIVSLLDMQQEKNQSPELQEPFIQAKANVRSISLIHENLYRHENLSTVEMSVFIQDLCKQVDTMYNPFKRHVSYAVTCADIFLDIDTAVPLGLIINELLTNSYKYAFPHVENLQVNITLREEEPDVYELAYSDNGPGITIPIHEATSMGMNLIKDLGRQVAGQVSYSMGQDSVFTLKFLSLKARKEID